jgi:hypothetical protein
MASLERTDRRRLNMFQAVTWLRRLGLAVAGALVCASSLALPVAAREAVDPSTLNPPPPDFINAQCGWSGQGVTCSFDYRFSVIDAETGIVCDTGHELFETSERHVFGHRYYDSNLNLVKRFAAERIDGIVYDGVTGVPVRWTGYDQGTELLSVPGDRSTGIRYNEGAIIHIYLDSGRSYMLFGGRSVENVDDGTYEEVGSHATLEFCGGIAANS